MAYYNMSLLKPNLLYIKWNATPKAESEDEAQFLADLHFHLEQAKDKLFIISDLREGRIITIETLRQLSEFAQHPNWGGGTSFTDKPSTRLLAGMFSYFVHQVDRDEEAWRTPQEALAYLESLSPGLTKGLDWSFLLKEEAS
jgi:hypothetical protein